jgi:hypothetical protein
MSTGDRWSMAEVRGLEVLHSAAAWPTGRWRCRSAREPVRPPGHRARGGLPRRIHWPAGRASSRRGWVELDPAGWPVASRWRRRARTPLQDRLVDWPNSSSCSCLTPPLVRPRRHSGWSDKAAHHSIGVILVAAPAAIGRADPALPMAAPPGRRATGGPDNHSLHLHDDLPGPPARATDRPATPRRATTSWALDIQRNHSERPAGGAAERATSCHHELCRAAVPLGWRLESATWR